MNSYRILEGSKGGVWRWKGTNTYVPGTGCFQCKNLFKD